MVSRSVPVLLALTVTLFGAASCGEESATSDCIDKAADAYNGIDLSRFTPADGFSDGEYERFKERVQTQLNADPDLAEGGRCQRELDGQVLPEIGDQLDPDVQQAFKAYTEALVRDLEDGPP